MLEHFQKLERSNPTWRQPNLKKVYDKLRQNFDSYYWGVSNEAGIPGSDRSKCPNEKDMEFICEQLWLGECVDASYRFAKWTLLWSSERRLYL